MAITNEKAEVVYPEVPEELRHCGDVLKQVISRCLDRNPKTR